MWRERMRAAALEAFRQQGASSVVTNAYAREFDRAWGGASDPLPCPKCFMGGRVSSLLAERGSGASLFRCLVCSEAFEADADKATAPPGRSHARADSDGVSTQLQAVTP